MDSRRECGESASGLRGRRACAAGDPRRIEARIRWTHAMDPLDGAGTMEAGDERGGCHGTKC